MYIYAECRLKSLTDSKTVLAYQNKMNGILATCLSKNKLNFSQDEMQKSNNV